MYRNSPRSTSETGTGSFPASPPRLPGTLYRSTWCRTRQRPSLCCCTAAPPCRASPISGLDCRSHATRLSRLGPRRSVVLPLSLPGWVPRRCCRPWLWPQKSRRTPLWGGCRHRERSASSPSRFLTYTIQRVRDTCNRASCVPLLPEWRTKERRIHVSNYTSFILSLLDLIMAFCQKHNSTMYIHTHARTNNQAVADTHTHTHTHTHTQKVKCILLNNWGAFHQAFCQCFSLTNLLSANQMQGFQ